MSKRQAHVPPNKPNASTLLFVHSLAAEDGDELPQTKPYPHGSPPLTMTFQGLLS
jgi:hypothetical protein